MGIAVAKNRILEALLDSRVIVVVRKVTKKSKRKSPTSAAPTPLNCESDVVQNRLSRIEGNYVRLDELLTDLEAKMPAADEQIAMQALRKKPR